MILNQSIFKLNKGKLTTSKYSNKMIVQHKKVDLIKIILIILIQLSFCGN